MTRMNGVIHFAAGALFAALLAYGVEAPEGSDRGGVAAPAAQAAGADAPTPTLVTAR